MRSAAAAMRFRLLVVIAAAVTAFPLSAEEASPREKALDQFGLIIPKDMVCLGQSFDERDPLNLPITCRQHDNGGTVQIDILEQPAFDLRLIGDALPYDTAWIRTAKTTTLPPIRWGFDAGWLYHPRLTSRELLCARTTKPLDGNQVSALCLSVSSPGERVVSVKFRGFGLEGGFGYFPLQAQDDAILEMSIEAIALKVDLLD